MIYEDTTVVTVTHADKTHAQFLAHFNGLRHYQITGWKGQPLTCLDQHSSTFAAHHARLSMTVDAAAAQMRYVLRHTAQPGRADSLRLSENQRLRGALRHNP
jgi:hypothetical protein